jgi:hypothetical protein
MHRKTVVPPPGMQAPMMSMEQPRMRRAADRDARLNSPDARDAPPHGYQREMIDRCSQAWALAPTFHLLAWPAAGIARCIRAARYVGHVDRAGRIANHRHAFVQSVEAGVVGWRRV